MAIISQDIRDNQEREDRISYFLKKYSIGKLLVKCGADKEKGICIVAIFRYRTRPINPRSSPKKKEVRNRPLRTVMYQVVS